MNKVSGQPFAIAEIEAAIAKFFDSVPGNQGGEVLVNEDQLPSPEAHND